jgi:beta-fructofuranosidase
MPHENDRSRPQLHFTVSTGWTNDPHGIVHVDGEYHLFFQHNPVGTSWSPACHWGHAVSTDLIRWNELKSALSPEPGEVGCWSGSCVVDDDGPVILYTRIVGDDWGSGQIALARPAAGDLTRWERRPTAAVIAAPPENERTIAFRDPFVWRTGDGWTALVGAGLEGFGGCALQYHSADLENWTYDGILASKPASERDPEWTGTAWECPQLFRLGTSWVLLVSVWENDVTHYVAYAVGDYDGRNFHPRLWRRFSYGQLYATTTFLDEHGRRCIMSWMREMDDVAPPNAPWGSAMSLPQVLGLNGDRLVVSHHPALETYLTDERQVPAIRPNTGSVDAGDVGPVWRLTAQVAVGPVGRLDIEVARPGEPLWRISIVGQDQVLSIHRSDRGLMVEMPMGGLDGILDVLADNDILEITWSGGSGLAATRILCCPTAQLGIRASGGLIMDEIVVRQPAR